MKLSLARPSPAGSAGRTALWWCQARSASTPATQACPWPSLEQGEAEAANGWQWLCPGPFLLQGPRASPPRHTEQ